MTGVKLRVFPRGRDGVWGRIKKKFVPSSRKTLKFLLINDLKVLSSRNSLTPPPPRAAKIPPGEKCLDSTLHMTFTCTETWSTKLNKGNILPKTAEKRVIGFKSIRRYSHKFNRPLFTFLSNAIGKMDAFLCITKLTSSRLSK